MWMGVEPQGEIPLCGEWMNGWMTCLANLHSVPFGKPAGGLYGCMGGGCMVAWLHGCMVAWLLSPAAAGRNLESSKSHRSFNSVSTAGPLSQRLTSLRGKIGRMKHRISWFVDSRVRLKPPEIYKCSTIYIASYRICDCFWLSACSAEIK